MPQAFYAFYWTLPVPRVGFTSLPKDVLEAAKISKTIRYSRDLVHAHVKMSGGFIVPNGERVALELYPDRGSSELGAEFGKLLDQAQARGAKLAVVNFAEHGKWRGHQYLRAYYDHPFCEVVPTSYEHVHLGGMNPYEHFAAWRQEQRAHSLAKPQHTAQILSALDAIDASSLVARAEELNAQGLKTHTGRSWTAENLRKFLRLHEDRNSPDL